MLKLIYSVVLTLLFIAGVPGFSSQAHAQSAGAEVNFAFNEVDLVSATDASELVELLRQTPIDLRAPQIGLLKFVPNGAVGNPNGQQPYFYGLASLGAALRPGNEVTSVMYADAVRASLNGSRSGTWGEITLADEWNEAAAWDKLVSTIDEGLLQSGEGYSQNENGHVGFSVSSVQVLQFDYVEGEQSAEDFFLCCMEQAEGVVFTFRPVPRLVGDDGGKVSGESFSVNALIIGFQPVAGPEPAESAEDAQDIEMASRYIQAGCSRASNIGSSVVSVGGRGREGAASATMGPDGQLLLTLAGFEGDSVNHCLVLYAETKLDSGEHDVSSPTSESQAQFIAAFAPRFDMEDGPLIVGSAGKVLIDTLQPSVSGTYRIEGWMLDPAGERREIVVEGNFVAPNP